MKLPYWLEYLGTSISSIIKRYKLLYKSRKDVIYDHKSKDDKKDT